MTETSEKVAMRAVQSHTYDGQAYEPGDAYDAEAQYVETLEAIKFAVRADAAPTGTASEPPAAQ